MENTPLVSICINNYNYGRYLAAAIDSALAQTWPHTEIIVVDDGSTDDSTAVMARYDRAITALHQENRGHAAALNAGFAASRGDVVVFLDADDTLLPGAAEQAVAALAQAGVVKAHWPLWRIDAEGRRDGTVEPRHTLAAGNLLAEITRYGPAWFCGQAYTAPTSGNAWARWFLNEIFPLPEPAFRSGGVDYFLTVLAPVFGAMVALREPQGQYRVHGANDTLQPVDAYIEKFFGWFAEAWQALGRQLAHHGIAFDSASWARDTWYHKIQQSLQEIQALVKPAARFILVDGNHLGLGQSVAGRTCVPFVERNGCYWGEPENDHAAIEEVERQRGGGASGIFFAWPAFWCLDYYTGLHGHLRANYRRILENERLIAFDLSGA